MRYTPNRPFRIRLLLLIALATSVQNCGAQDVRWSGPPLSQVTLTTPPQGAELLLVAADLPRLREMLTESDVSEPLGAYLAAEMDLLEGQFSRSAERFSAVLMDQPDSLLGAMAVFRLTQLGDLVGDFHIRIPDSTAPLENLACNPLTAQYLNLLALQVAHSQHNRLGIEFQGPFSGEALGLPDEWRYAGPFSIHPHLHLGRPEPFDDQLVLADLYQHEGRRMETHPLLGNKLSVSLSAPSTGTYVFETWAHLDTDSARIAILETSARAIVEIDGRIAVRRSLDGAYDPLVLMRPIHLQAGWHRVRVILGIERSPQDFRLRLVSPRLGEPGLSFAARPPDGIAMAPSQVGTGPGSGLCRILPPQVVQAADPLSAFALLLFSTDFGEDELVERSVAHLTQEGETSPFVDMMTAWFAGNRATLAPNERRSRQLRRVRQALTTAPSAGGAALTLAGLLSQDDRDQEAMLLLEPFTTRLASEGAMVMGLVELYLKHGWNELAEPELARLLQTYPDACGLIERLIETWILRDHLPDPDSLPLGFHVCEAGLVYRTDNILLPQGQIEQAIEVRRVLADRYPDDPRHHRRLFDLLMREGRYTEALAEIERADAYLDDPVERTLSQVDWLLTRERTDEALDMLSQTLATEKPGNYNLLQAQAFLDGRGLLEDLRVDTHQAIQAYRNRETRLMANTIYALDYGAYRYYPQGGAVAITHQILHIQSREALTQYGEIAIPTNSLLLRARTIKADGTILEPDNIPGKDTISLPNLEVGDFAEFEYLDLYEPSYLRGNTALGSRFYFQLPDSAFSRSELIVEVPEDWSDLIVDLRAGAPQAEFFTHGGYRRFRFAMFDSLPPVLEPNTPPMEELVPSVRVAHGVTWSDVRDAYWDRQLGVVRSHPQILAETEALVADIDDPVERVHRIYRYVIDEIEDIGGFLSSEAIWTLGLGEGERLPLLLAMLQAARLDAEMVFLRSWQDDQSDSPIPDASQYPETVLRVRVPNQDIWLMPTQDYGVFNYLTPELQNAEGIVIAPTNDGSVERVRTPRWPSESNLNRIEIQLVVDEQGNVIGHIIDQESLRASAMLRMMLERIQDEQTLIQELEQLLAPSFAGVVVDDLQSDPLDDPDRPVGFRYHFRARGFGHLQDSQMIIDTHLFDRGLREMLGTLPERRYPLAIPLSFREELRVRILLPEGFRFVDLPEEISIDHSLLQYQWNIEEGGLNQSDVTLVRQTRLEIGRIPPIEYPHLYELLQQVAQAEALHLVARR